MVLQRMVLLTGESIWEASRLDRTHYTRSVPALGACVTTVLYSNPRRGMGESET
jgi:hypothetical protein